MIEKTEVEEKVCKGSEGAEKADEIVCSKLWKHSTNSDFVLQRSDSVVITPGRASWDGNLKETAKKIVEKDNVRIDTSSSCKVTLRGKNQI